jgi:hypothetical protein
MYVLIVMLIHLPFVTARLGSEVVFLRVGGPENVGTPRKILLVLKLWLERSVLLTARPLC